MRSWKSISFQEPGGCPGYTDISQPQHCLQVWGSCSQFHRVAVVKHHCQVDLLHICTTTQDVELRFFRVSRLSAAELEAQPWLGWGITTFWNICSISGREVPAPVVLKMSLQRRPAMSMASWVLGPGCAAWHPPRFLTVFLLYRKFHVGDCPRQTNAQYFL